MQIAINFKTLRKYCVPTWSQTYQVVSPALALDAFGYHKIQKVKKSENAILVFHLNQPKKLCLRSFPLSASIALSGKIFLR